MGPIINLISGKVKVVVMKYRDVFNETNSLCWFAYFQRFLSAAFFA